MPEDPKLLRILLVDDDPDCAESVAALLKRAGDVDEVLVAYNGRDALGVVEDFAPDLVIIDVGLPDLDGHELARRLRGSMVTDACAIVALSGYDQPEDERHGLDAGFDAYMVKPIDVEDLATVVAKMVADGRSGLIKHKPPARLGRWADRRPLPSLKKR